MDSHNRQLAVIGGGLAGSEAAWQAAGLGCQVDLYEMKPLAFSPAHHSPLLGELVCSNSLRSDAVTSAVGLLKQEMRFMGSLLMEAAEQTRVPAGKALAVDREKFARFITHKIDSNDRITVVPRWKVANAIGAALARTTCEVNFFADTEQGRAEAPEENYNRSVDRNFDSQAAVQEALNLLKEKAVQRGASPDNLETEIVEALQFNMVRGFQSTGKNIRVKVQVKPGLIHGYENTIAKLSE